MDQQTVDRLHQLEQQKFYSQAMDLLKSSYPQHGADEKWMESALLKMTELLVEMEDESKIVPFLQSTACPMFEAIPTKAKTTKILKSMLDRMAKFVSSPVQTAATKLLVEWSIAQNRVYLRQALETRLVGLYLEIRAYSDALTLIAALLKELKKLDDKLALVEVFSLESRCYHALRNLPKSRASLTSARSSANSIYCPPLLQAQLDMQSGVLHAEEQDFKTAYSYFYEAMEGYSSQNEMSLSLQGLKYMLLCKIMLGLADDVFNIMTGKMALKFQGSNVDAMRAVASAYKSRSLSDFQKTLADYTNELQNDSIVKFHLQALYDQLLEQNLVRVIEPYSRVQISHVAETVKLPLAVVEQKLSQMILDKSFSGTLDQRDGSLHVFDTVVVDQTFATAIETIHSMGLVVESLYEKARTL
eukprot:Partr_v1_DN26287_c0_g1_i1_m48304 putative 26S Proteasome non-ATPase regulatory subunit